MSQSLSEVSYFPLITSTINGGFMVIKSLDNMWNNRLSFSEVMKNKWWRDYLNILKLFYNEKYQKVIDQLALYLCEDDIQGEFQLLLYRMWIEVLVLDPATEEQSSFKCLKLIRDHLQKISEVYPQDYLDSLAALVGLTHYYQQNDQECDLFLLDWQKNYKHKKIKNSYVEELIYKIENMNHSKDHQVIHISSYHQYIKQTYSSDDSAQSIEYIQSFDYLTLQTLLAYTCSKNQFSTALSACDQIQKLFGKTPLKQMVKVYQALADDLQKEAQNHAKELTELYPSSINLQQMYAQIVDQSPNPRVQFKLSIDQAMSAVEKDHHHVAVEFLNKANNLYLQLYNSIDDHQCAEYKNLWHLIEQKWGFNKNHQRTDLDNNKAVWMCFVSDKTFCDFFDKSDHHNPLILSLEHEIRENDLVCLVKQESDKTIVIGIYSIDAALPFRFGLESNTVLKPEVVFVNNNSYPSINLPEIIDNRQDHQALMRRKFGCDVSFRLDKGIGLLLEQINKTTFIESSKIKDLQQRWIGSK